MISPTRLTVKPLSVFWPLFSACPPTCPVVVWGRSPKGGAPSPKSEVGSPQGEGGLSVLISQFLIILGLGVFAPLAAAAGKYGAFLLQRPNGSLV